MTRQPRAYPISKRLLDLAIAIPALIVLSPVMLLIAAMVTLTIGSPVLFRQQRPGLNGRLFTILKFRTMLDMRGPDGSLLPDTARLPQFGRWLRSTSLDELPELWNVICGEMSLVGPRPLLSEYLNRYSATQARRHEVPPGLTGWAQVNGRNGLDWDDKLAMDVWYVDNRSLGLDLKILGKTALAVLRRDGIAADGSVTMPEFMGPRGVLKSRDRDKNRDC